MPSIQRALLVGLGRHGKYIVEQTWLGLQQRTDLPEGLFPYINALVINTAMEDEANDGCQVILPSDSYLTLKTSGMQAYLQSLIKDKLPGLDDLPPDTNVKFYGTGSEQDIAATRLGMHLLFSREKCQIAGALDLHLNRLMMDDEWSWTKDSRYQPVLDNTVRVYIVAALDEVDGGGFLPVILQMLPNLNFFQENQRRYISTGIFTCFGAISGGDAAANTYASFVELNGLFAAQLKQNGDDRFDPRRLSTNQACYIVEAVDERGRPFESSDEGDTLVIQFLTSTLSCPIPSAMEGEGILVRYETVLKEQTRMPELPLFSSFSQTEYTVLREPIEKYLAARVGEQVTSSEGLACEPGTDASLEITKRAQNFLDRQGLDPKSLIGKVDNTLMVTLVDLDFQEQRQALSVTRPEEIVASRDALTRAIQLITRKESERQNCWQEYQTKTLIHVNERVAENVGQAISHFTDGFVNDKERNDSLGRGQIILNLLQSRLSEWRDTLAEGLDRKKERAEMEGEHALEIETAAKIAIENAPRALNLMVRVILSSLISLLVWCLVILVSFSEQVVDSTWATLALRLAHGLGVLITPLGVLYLVNAGLLAIKSMPLDWFIGRYRLRRYGHNVPGWDQLLLIMGWPVLSFALVASLAYRHLIYGNTAYLNLFPMSLPNILLIAAGINGLFDVLLYGWWFFRDVAHIRHAIAIWTDTLQSAANWNMYIHRHNLVSVLYQQLLQKIEGEISRLAGYRNKLLAVHDVLIQTQEDTLTQLIQSEHRFRKLAIADKASLDRVYFAQLANNPDLHCRALLMSLPINLSAWLEKGPQEVARFLENFVAEKLSSFWLGRNLVTILTPEANGNSVLLRNELQPKLNFFRNFGPQWSLHSQVGELQVFAGVGDEENKALTSALRGLGTVTFQSLPQVYETGDPFSITMTLTRHGRPLYELEEVLGYRSVYEQYPAWKVHTRRSNLLDPISDDWLKLKTSLQVQHEVPQEERTSSEEQQSPIGALSSEDAARALLQLKPEATDSEINTQRQRLLEKLEEARKGLLEKSRRYIHFSAIERGKLIEPNWFDLLNLPRNRNIKAEEVQQAFEDKKTELGLAVELLLGSQNTEEQS